MVRACDANFQYGNSHTHRASIDSRTFASPRCGVDVKSAGQKHAYYYVYGLVRIRGQSSAKRRRVHRKSLGFVLIFSREYTLYCISSDGRVEKRQNIHANDDLGTLDQARKLCHDYEIEIWQHEQIITRLAKDGRGRVGSCQRSLAVCQRDYHGNHRRNANRAGLKNAIESRHGGKATFVQAVPVHETHNGETVWDGLVHIFDIKKHPNGAWRAYACSDERDDDPRRLFTVLHSPNIDGPRKAVAAAIVGKHRSGK